MGHSRGPRPRAGTWSLTLFLTKTCNVIPSRPHPPPVTSSAKWTTAREDPRGSFSVPTGLLSGELPQDGEVVGTVVPRGRKPPHLPFTLPCFRFVGKCSPGLSRTSQSSSVRCLPAPTCSFPPASLKGVGVHSASPLTFRNRYREIWGLFC